MFSSDNRVGRLVELRVQTPMNLEEMAELQRRHLQVLQSLEGSFVIVTDLRHAHVFPPDITEAFIQMMGRINPDLERSAVLINESAVLGLQAERAIAEAGNPNRRSFREPDELMDWLSDVLDPSERTRLQAFLHEGE
ncbi:MAG: hypothetical protein MPN21_23645 [Thermoanaerobaculia bacterium]|nr:hypothetical protein [Thermoanaerobaculia bacterium]